MFRAPPAPPTADHETLSYEDIDALFAFAKATDIKVIYSLHFADGVETAKYVWAKYRPYVDYFAFDNEPDNRLEGGSGAAVGPSWGDYRHLREFATCVVSRSGREILPARMRLTTSW